MYHLPMRLIFSLLLLALVSCSRLKKEDDFCVTYRVSFSDVQTHKLLISYNTADGLETLYHTGNWWEQEVCLGPDGMASLFVEDIFEVSDEFIYQDIERLQEPQECALEPLTVQIIYKNKIVRRSGEGLVWASLFQSDIGR